VGTGDKTSKKVERGEKKQKLFNPRMNAGIKPVPRDAGKYYKKDQYLQRNKYTPSRNAVREKTRYRKGQMKCGGNGKRNSKNPHAKRKEDVKKKIGRERKARQSRG